MSTVCSTEDAECRIISRELVIAFHNGRTFISKPAHIELNPSPPPTSPDEAHHLFWDGITYIKFYGDLENDCWLYSSLEYVLEWKDDPNDELAPTFTHRVILGTCMRNCSHASSKRATNVHFDGVVPNRMPLTNDYAWVTEKACLKITKTTDRAVAKFIIGPIV